MSALQVNGADLSELTLTYSWGLSPASATVVMPGEQSVSAGTDVSFVLGGLTFHGVTSAGSVATDDGQSTRLEVTDNRLKLLWDDVYCTFNNVEVRADDPETPGIDRQKRFWHILPDDWDAQIKTWTDEAYSAAAVIDYLLAADTVNFDWTATTHAAQEKKVLGIDANQGAKLGNVLHEISERHGLVFTLRGEFELVWARKGDGIAPTPPATTATDIRSGEALSHNDTAVRLIGDRNQYQDMPVELEPDWNSFLEPYWSEPAWWDQVDLIFGPFDADTAGQASLAAKAREVTLRQYVNETGNVLLEDYGLWGEAGRMDIPLWLYLRDIVFKAYRIPRSYTVNGIPLESLEMKEGLHAAVDHDIDDGSFGIKSPREFYPDAKAYVIAQGQQLSLLDPRTKAAITAEQLTNARTKWAACNNWNLDLRNKTIIFQDAVFLPGAGDAGLFIFPNHGVAGIETTDPIYNLAVPNADVTVAAAVVRAVLVFEAEIYSKRYGSGVRHGPRVVKDLCYHAIMESGSFVEEVKYVDGESADDKAAEEAANLILSQPVYLDGGYRRHGACGTVLNGSIDRVTVNVSFGEGLVETIEYSKERSQSNFEHERELDRRQRQKDLFPGQKANKQEVENLRIISRLSKELPRLAPTSYRSPSEVLQRPVGGGGQVAPTTVLIEGDTRAAGEAIWAAADGETIDDTGPVFLGVTIAAGSVGRVALAASGTAPVLVKGPVAAGDTVGETDGAGSFVQKDGARHVGVACASYSGTGTALIPVRLGAGGSHLLRGFEIVPINEEGSAPAIRVVVSTLGGDVPLGMYPTDDPIFTVVVTGDSGVIVGKLTYTPTTGEITAREILLRETRPGDDRDEGEAYALIGGFSVVDGVVSVHNLGYGPITASICRDYFSDPVRYGVTFFFPM